MNIGVCLNGMLIIFIQKLCYQIYNGASIMFLGNIYFNDQNNLKYIIQDSVKKDILDYIQLEKKIYINDDITKYKIDELFKQITLDFNFIKLMIL